VRHVRVQRMHHRRPFLNDPNPRMATTVEPPLVTLGQAEPPLQIEIVADPRERALADKQARNETDHDSGHLAVNRIPGPLEARRQLLKLLLAPRALPLCGIEGRGDFADLLDIPSDRRLLGRDLVQATVDAAG
jgi:hypothetical protein